MGRFTIIGGVFSNKPLYYLFAADKIQISKTTWLMLSMKGGYIMEERGVIEVKVVFLIFKSFLESNFVPKIMMKLKR